MHGRVRLSTYKKILSAIADYKQEKEESGKSGFASQQCQIDLKGTRYTVHTSKRHMPYCDPAPRAAGTG
jgi:hypothetical protein